MNDSASARRGPDRAASARHVSRPRRRRADRRSDRGDRDRAQPARHRSGPRRVARPRWSSRRRCRIPRHTRCSGARVERALAGQFEVDLDPARRAAARGPRHGAARSRREPRRATASSPSARAPSTTCASTRRRSTGKPYAVFATAPSMNGYTSANAAITVDGHKQTLPAACRPRRVRRPRGARRRAGAPHSRRHRRFRSAGPRRRPTGCCRISCAARRIATTPFALLADDEPGGWRRRRRSCAAISMPCAPSRARSCCPGSA